MSNTELLLLATAVTRVTVMTPFGPVSTTSEAVKVGALIFLSKVTLTVLNEPLEPLNTAETTFGPPPVQRNPGAVGLAGGDTTTGGTVTGGTATGGTGGTTLEASSNFAKLMRPFDVTRPLKLLNESTEIFNLSRTWA